jgi:hypothetical protein
MQTTKFTSRKKYFVSDGNIGLMFGMELNNWDFGNVLEHIFEWKVASVINNS